KSSQQTSTLNLSPVLAQLHPTAETEHRFVEQRCARRWFADNPSMSQPIKITSRIRLRDFDPDYCGGLDKDETREKTRKLCERIAELQHLLYANASHAVIILLQGMDCSGKDSTGASVLEFVTPAGVQTANFKAPSTEELSHDFLWRVHKE